ncbi:MAG: hypothetical protein N2258_02360 [Brevinematales bacterium]|nr:hypothetical protein [Brevinematales bacterium]
MKKSKLDEIRERTGIVGLSEKEKKEMFQKFVNAGGKVVELEENKRRAELKKRAALISDNKMSSKKKEEHLPREVNKEYRNYNPINRWIEKFSSMLDCFFNRILSFGGRSFTEKFKNFLLIDFQNALIRSRMILASILYQDKIVSQEIKKKLLLDNTFPYYYELVYRFDNLYDENKFAFLERMKISLETVDEVKPVILSLFKELMILQPYLASLKAGIEKGLWLEKELRNLPSTIYYENLKRITYNVDFIFGKVYSKLFLLVDFYYRQRSKLDETLREFLDFDEKDSVGYYTFIWKQELTKIIKEEERLEKQKIEKENKETPTDAIQDLSGNVADGIKFILANISPEQSMKKFVESKDNRALFNIKDKIFYTYLIVDFFDKEFSFVFTSNRVEFGIVFIDGNRIDVRKELSNIYYRFNNLLEKIDDYLKLLRELKKVEEDSFMSFQEKNSRLNQISIQRSQLSRVIRKDAKNLFEEFTNKLLYIISDYQGENKILQNPDSLIEFDLQLDGERFSNGKKVIEIIESAYKYSSAASFLFSEADLGGLGIFLEKPIYLNFDLSTTLNV